MIAPPFEPELLRAILAAPADDAPRRVYADWLEEHQETVRCSLCRGEGEVETGAMGYVPEDRINYIKCPACHGTGIVSNGLAERAEFIRVQVELAKIPAYRHAAKRSGISATLRREEALRRREEELFSRFGASWLPEPLDVGTLPHTPESCVPEKRGEFRRGLIESLTFPGELLAAVVDRVCPDLERVCDGCGGKGSEQAELECTTFGGDRFRVKGMVTACPTCHGKGTVARVLTGVEQPVSIVRITSDVPNGIPGMPGLYYDSYQALLDGRWPRRTWALELPDGQRIEPPTKERVRT